MYRKLCIYPINHFSRGNNLDKTMFRVCLFILNFFIFGGNIKRQRGEWKRVREKWELKISLKELINYHIIRINTCFIVSFSLHVLTSIAGGTIKEKRGSFLLMENKRKNEIVFFVCLLVSLSVVVQSYNLFSM